MKFSVQASTLSRVLATAGRTISNKSMIPILDYFMFEIADGRLSITASDTQTTIRTSIPVEGDNGSVAVPSKLFQDILKQFGDDTLSITVDDKYSMTVSYHTGSLQIPCADPAPYPVLPDVPSSSEVSMSVDVFLRGLSKTLVAVAHDELRPVMNGVYFDGTHIVATDAHKLVVFAHTEDNDCHFILPTKSASLLQKMMLKMDGEVSFKVNDKNAVFTFGDTTLYVRLISGNYPNYQAVIPQNNPNRVRVDKSALLNTIKRCSVCSNPTTNLIRMVLSDNTLAVNSQDMDSSASAKEVIPVEYRGNTVEIGFNSMLLLELLNNIDTEEVCIELADGSRAAVFRPTEGDMLELLMPMSLA